MTFFRCCPHCTQDPLWHREHEPDTHPEPCMTVAAVCQDGGAEETPLWRLGAEPEIYLDEDWCYGCDRGLWDCTCG